MSREQLRTEHPEIAAVVDSIRAAGGTITAMALYVDDRLVAGKPPVDPPGTVWVSAESYEKMRAHAAAPVVRKLPRSPR